MLTISVTMRRVAVVTLLLSAVACAGSPPRAPEHPAPVHDVWTTSLGASSPLVGRAYGGTPPILGDRERIPLDATFVLLGEKHDNPDHHRLQAELLRALTASGRRPAVVFEQIDRDLQPAIDAYLQKTDTTVDGLATVLEWDKRGWPPFSIYRPIFEVALTQHLAVVAGGLGKDLIRAVVKQGVSALPPDVASRLHLEPLAPALSASLDDELRASHCGALPESMIAPMNLAQRVKDAWMAELLLSHKGTNGAVLIAGNGHVRHDRGVPEYLRRGDAGVRSTSVSVLEVGRGQDDAASYAEGAPADWLVFTPRVDDEDPCAGFTHGK